MKDASERILTRMPVIPGIYLKRWNREVKRLKRGLPLRFVWKEDEEMLIRAEASTANPPVSIFGQPHYWGRSPRQAR